MKPSQNNRVGGITQHLAVLVSYEEQLQNNRVGGVSQPFFEGEKQ